MPDPNSVPLFRCKSCFALYQVVKAQAGPETVDPQIACRVCNGPLAAREGHFVLKYFLLREASRLDARRAPIHSASVSAGNRPRNQTAPISAVLNSQVALIAATLRWFVDAVPSSLPHRPSSSSEAGTKGRKPHRRGKQFTRFPGIDAARGRDTIMAVALRPLA